MRQDARAACENSGYAASDHVVDTTNMIIVARGAHCAVDNVHLLPAAIAGM
jgi:hypothetical protein